MLPAYTKTKTKEIITAPRAKDLGGKITLAQVVGYWRPKPNARGARAGHGLRCGLFAGAVRAVPVLRSGLRVRARERARAGHGIAVGGLRRWGTCCARLAVRVVCVYSGTGVIRDTTRAGLVWEVYPDLTPPPCTGACWAWLAGRVGRRYGPASDSLAATSSSMAAAGQSNWG